MTLHKNVSALCLFLGALACSGDAAGPAVAVGPGSVPTDALLPSHFVCDADLATPAIQCTRSPGAGPVYAPGNESDRSIIAGPSVLSLSVSGVTDDQADHRLAFNVTLTNRKHQPLGTTDGIKADSSLTIFFTSTPVATGGAGKISIANATGTGNFTAPDQPYFRYFDMLRENESIDSQKSLFRDQQLVLQYDPSVTSFRFTLLVSANVQYPHGYIDIAPRSEAVGPGSSVQLQHIVRDALGDAFSYQQVSWKTSDPSVATIDRLSGVVKALAPGSITATATQGQATGTANIQITDR